MDDISPYDLVSFVEQNESKQSESYFSYYVPHILINKAPPPPEWCNVLPYAYVTITQAKIEFCGKQS